VTVWPDTLWLVRHAESAGNIARDAALSAGLHEIDVHVRDVDVPLSPLGERQAAALGRWFGAMPSDHRPTVILTSPYVRAARTAEIMRQTAGLDATTIPTVVDERLREKEFGILDRLTRVGIDARHPEQADLRRLLGKFYHRPPGGESWCDVILRLRTVVEMMTREYGRERVLIVCHSVVVLCFRYILEHMTEAQILGVDRDTDVANCSVTTYHCEPGQDGRARGSHLALSTFNFVAPLEAEGAPVTAEPDANAAIR
jgi:2,3-bisphosphoglycerate-dependent phosphoglycerate mutase